jgi:hypothetical protein
LSAPQRLGAKPWWDRAIVAASDSAVPSSRMRSESWGPRRAKLALEVGGGGRFSRRAAGVARHPRPLRAAARGKGRGGLPLVKAGFGPGGIHVEARLRWRQVLTPDETVDKGRPKLDRCGPPFGIYDAGRGDRAADGPPCGLLHGGRIRSVSRHWQGSFASVMRRHNKQPRGNRRCSIKFCRPWQPSFWRPP